MKQRVRQAGAPEAPGLSELYRI